MRSVVLTDVSCHLKEIVRNRQLLIWIILVPLIISGVSQLIVTALETDNSVPVSVHLQSKDPGSLFSQMVETEVSSRFTVIDVDRHVDTQTYIDSVMADDPTGLVVFIVLPDNFDYYVLSSMTAGEFEANLHAGGMDFLFDVLKTGSCNYSDGLPHVTGFYNKDEQVSGVSDFLFGDGSIRDYYFVTTMVTLVMMSLLSLIMGFVVDGRRSRLNLLLLHTSLTDSRVFASTFLWSLFPTLLTVLVVFLMFGMHSFMVPDLLFVPSILLLVLFGTAFSLFVSELVSDVQSTMMASGAVLIPMLMLSGSIVPVSFLPDFIQAISSFMPVGYVIDIVHAAFVPSDTLVQSLLVTLGFTVLFTVLWKVVRVIRRN